MKNEQLSVKEKLFALEEESIGEREEGEEEERRSVGMEREFETKDSNATTEITSGTKSNKFARPINKDEIAFRSIDGEVRTILIRESTRSGKGSRDTQSGTCEGVASREIIAFATEKRHLMWVTVGIIKGRFNHFTVESDARLIIVGSLQIVVVGGGDKIARIVERRSFRRKTNRRERDR